MGNHDYDEDTSSAATAIPLNSEYANTGFKNVGTGTSERIHQLEQQCATLAAEIDRMALVVDAAIEWSKYGLAESDHDELLEAIADYEVSKPK